MSARTLPHTPTASMTTPCEFARACGPRFELELCEWLRIPSISTLPAHQPDMDRAAAWLTGHLGAIGFEARVISGDGHPLVYAEWLRAPGRPTLLGYGHYDVQPADPLEAWTTPPFEPSVRGGNLHARGAADNKGQIFTLIKAAEAYLATGAALPVNVKLLVEGEEECGGSVLESYIRAHPDRLGADAAIVLDSGMMAPGIPAITLGLRGIASAEVEARGPVRDLHSGLYGGAAPNPFLALAQILAGLKDAGGRILIPHFYDRVIPPDPEEREGWARLGFDDAAFLREEVGALALVGESSFSVLERLWARPTLDVHGMPGGFIDEGVKTVIPARALAKVSMRLVARQDPFEIAEHFTAHVRRLTPPGVQVTVRRRGGAPAVLIDRRSPAIAAASTAFAEAFGHDTVYIRSGATVPVVSQLSDGLKIPTIVTGWALPDANWHSPDEKLSLTQFHRGIEALIRFVERFGASARGSDGTKTARPHSG
ncbi:MAG TPA: dipeptidase [bacterium]|nr:dipeptidase [bacterium]